MADNVKAEPGATPYYCSGRDGRRLDTCPGHPTFGNDCPAWDAHMAETDAIPDDPPGIDPHTLDLPSLAHAAERVAEFLRWWGDGRIITDPMGVDQPPLYARDLERLTQHAEGRTPPPGSTGGDDRD